MVDGSQSLPFIAFFETPAGDRVPIRGNCSIRRSQANEIVLADDRVSADTPSFTSRKQPSVGWWTGTAYPDGLHNGLH